jgi:hypothetical protein
VRDSYDNPTTSLSFPFCLRFQNDLDDFGVSIPAAEAEAEVEGVVDSAKLAREVEA